MITNIFDEIDDRSTDGRRVAIAPRVFLGRL